MESTEKWNIPGQKKYCLWHFSEQKLHDITTMFCKSRTDHLSITLTMTMISITYVSEKFLVLQEFQESHLIN